MECWRKVWTLLFFRVLPELLDCWRRGSFTTAIYIFLALYKLFVKFELKLLKKRIVLPFSLSSVAVFVLLGLNTTEANPIKYLKAKTKHCLVFLAEWHINESFGRAPLWWPWSRELCARAFLSLRNEVFRLVDWILWLPLRERMEGKHDDNKNGCDWLEFFTWNSRYSHPLSRNDTAHGIQKNRLT